MIKITCDQTGEDLTGKRHISVTRNSLRQQSGNGEWRNVAPWSNTGVLYFKDWETLAEWGREQEKSIEGTEWYAQPSRSPRVAY